MSLEATKQNIEPAETLEQEEAFLTAESSEPEVEQRELDLTNLDDLDVLLDNTEALYTELLNYEVIAMDDDFKALADSEPKGIQIFESFKQDFNSLKSQIDHCRYDIIPSESEIEEETFDLVQTLYNNLIDIRNRVLEAYPDTATAVTESLPEEVTLMDVPGLSSEELLEQTELQVDSAITYVTLVRDNLKDSFEESAGVDEVSGVIEEIDSYLKRIKELKTKIQDNKIANEDVAVLRNKLSVYGRIISEIQINVDVAEQVLLQNHNLIADSLDKKQEDETVTVSRTEIEEEESELNTFGGFSSRKGITVTGEDGVTDVEIDVTDKVLERLKENKTVPSKPKKSPFSFLGLGKKKRLTKEDIVTISSEQLSAPESAALAAVESHDPINEVIPDSLPDITTAFKEDVSKYEDYLSEDRYQDFIKNNFKSYKQFGRIVDSEVAAIENETLDFIDRSFGDSKSVFSYIEKMTIAEIIDLSSDNETREKLTADDIKYETFVNWVDLIDDARAEEWVSVNMKFGEFFTKWLIENAILDQP